MKRLVNFVPEVSLGSLAVLCSGVVFGLTLFFSLGERAQALEAKDVAHDKEDVRLQDEIDTNKSERVAQIAQVQAALAEIRRDQIAMMVALGVKPAGAQ